MIARIAVKPKKRERERERDESTEAPLEIAEINS
jgi:hypothetical protein